MKSLLRLKPYVKPLLGFVVASGLLAIPLAALRASPVPLVKYMVDDLLVSRDSSKLLLFPALFVGIFLINFVVRFLHYFLLRIVIARVNQALKKDLYEHFMSLSADYFTDRSTGDMISRVGMDPQYVDGGLANINILIREPITFIFLLGYALYLNWQLTLITVLTFPALALVFYATGKNLKRYISNIAEENAKIYSNLQESFSGFKVIKMFQLETYVKSKFSERLEKFTKMVIKTSLLEEVSHPLVELITAVAIAAGFYYGGLQVINGTMTSGDLLAFFTAFGMMINPLRLINQVNIKLNQASAAADRIFDALDWKPTVQAPKKSKNQISELKENLSFKQVSFSYPDDPRRTILQDINFTVERGKTLALVGASGSGKSSLISLIPRIFDVDDGTIEIDGKDIKDLSFQDLRSMISIVSQDVFLFNDTIESNIRCGRLDATTEEIHRAAEMANATDFIDKLPDGFNTIIGERGQKLSGGEKQRLSIARAFLRHSPILILDEATSNLDNVSEKVVQDALDKLMKDRTALIIAHRLSTIQNADQIVVLKEGRIVESGSHKELIDHQGEYSRFYQLTTLETQAGQT